jgi:putative tryptophan/tyrosine transport system substrate-binding protein
MAGDITRQAIIAVWLCIPITPAAADTVTLRYGQIPSTVRSVSALYLSIAQQKGLFAREEIKLDLIPIAGGTDKMIAALDQGTVDVVLVNPANIPSTQSTLRDIPEAARAMGLQIQMILNAATIGEIDAAFASVARERADALFVAPDIFYVSRAAQFATLTARDRIPATFANPDHVAAGGLMSYGTDVADTFRQVGVYTGSILKGAKAADLPVLQPTKFEFVINLQTARALGIDVPPELLAIADEVIE